MKRIFIFAITSFILLSNGSPVLAEGATQGQSVTGQTVTQPVTSTQPQTSQTSSSSTSPATTNNLAPQTQTSASTSTPPPSQASIPAPSSSTQTTIPVNPPATNTAVSSSTDPGIPEILDVKPISMEEFEARVMRVMASIIAFGRRISTPYMYVGLMIGALILLMPFANPLKKYAGWQTIVTALIAYLLIWWGPVFLGVIRGFTQ